MLIIRKLGREIRIGEVNQKKAPESRIVAPARLQPLVENPEMEKAKIIKEMAAAEGERIWNRLHIFGESNKSDGIKKELIAWFSTALSIEMLREWVRLTEQLINHVFEPERKKFGPIGSFAQHLLWLPDFYRLQELLRQESPERVPKLNIRVRYETETTTYNAGGHWVRDGAVRLQTPDFDLNRRYTYAPNFRYISGGIGSSTQVNCVWDLSEGPSGMMRLPY